MLFGDKNDRWEQKKTSSWKPENHLGGTFLSQHCPLVSEMRLGSAEGRKTGQMKPVQRSGTVHVTCMTSL